MILKIHFKGSIDLRTFERFSLLLGDELLYTTVG